jgi:ankyrin repeat protein
VTELSFIDAVFKGDEQELLDQVKQDPLLARARNEQGISVVCLGVYAGRLELARQIASVRDDLDVFEAACIGDTERIQALLKVAPDVVRATSPDGFSPLGYSAFFGHEQLLDVLIRADAQVNQASRNKMHVCPLHSAAAHHDPKKATRLARALLEAGADPNSTEQGGYTPLHTAASNGNLELAVLLLDHSADPTLKADGGKRPIDLAQEKGHTRIVDLLA